MKKKDLLITPSLYSLFLYLLINEDWTNSDYALSSRIPLVIHERLRILFGVNVYSSTVGTKGNVLSKIIKKNLDYFKYQRYSRKYKYERVWGNDEFVLSMKYRYQGIRLIEDGPYNSFDEHFFVKRRFKQEGILLPYWFYWIFKNYIPYGFNDNVKQIYHTSAITLNPKIARKGIEVNLRKSWDTLSPKRKSDILYLFGIKDELLKKINEYSTVCVTQVLPIPEEDKIELYRNLLRGVDESEVLIKTHYAETTDYKRYFPKASVISLPIPMQLFDLLGYSPKKILTISSSAITPFIKDGVEIIFLGTECDKRISDVYGIIRLEHILNK